VIEERTVGASLGADSIASGTKATLLGLLLVVIFMFAAYGLFGLFANIALVVNIALIFGVLSLIARRSLCRHRRHRAHQWALRSTPTC
jgi:preprotein translocase subunit SecD